MSQSSWVPSLHGVDRLHMSDTRSTRSSIDFVIPGHQTASVALRRHFKIPWCPQWIFSSVFQESAEQDVSIIT